MKTNDLNTLASGLEIASTEAKTMKVASTGGSISIPTISIPTVFCSAPGIPMSEVWNNLTSAFGSASGSASGGGVTSGSGSETGQGKNSRPKPADVKQECSTQETAARNSIASHVNMFKGITGKEIGANTYISWSDYLATVNARPGIEHSTTIFDYTANGYGMCLTYPKSGTSNGVDISYYPGNTPVGSIHSHPNGTPPSATDVITAGRIAGDCPNYTSHTIYDPSSGCFWTIYITDSSQAAAFAAMYGSHVGSDNWWASGSGMANYLGSNDFSNFTPNERQAFQLADILSNFDSGMRLVKSNPNGSSEAYGVKQRSGYKYKTPTKCK